jgi:iron complex outermembrane receptor protein
MRTKGLSLGFALLTGSAAHPLAAQAQPRQVALDAPEDWEKLLAVKVESAAKGERQSLADAPAIISVVTGDEIRALGYRSVAQALEAIPGFYAVDDRVAANFGVRGINGGLRAYSRIIKVMINGQPVAFRPDGANLLGPELIPMEAVERIEVIRGPASSLYGADAFLGVVNIITRKPDQDRQPSSLLARAGTGGPGAFQGLEGRWGVVQDTWDLLMAVSGSREDRSGYALPSCSPILRTDPALATRTSSNDLSHPASALVSATLLPAEGLTLGLLGQFSHLEAHGEFLDFGLFSPDNTIALDNSFVRIKADWIIGTDFRMVASAALASGQPGSKEYLDAGETASHPRREIGYRAVDTMVEGRWSFHARDSLTLGVDHTTDRERLMTVFTESNSTGATTPILGDQGRKTFANSGFYAQGILYPAEALGVTLNLRQDRHNIYGDKTTYRIGLVYSFTSELHGKVLHGTSFKAPTAWQLYAQPLFGGDVIGNAGLKPETARTTEVEIGWKPRDPIALSLNAFWNRVGDQVRLFQQNGNQLPQNAMPQASRGLEAVAQFHLGRQQLSGSLAWQRTDAHLPVPFGPEVVEPTALYPSLTAFVRWRFLFSPNQSAGLQGHYGSSRRATDSNITENFLHPYLLGAYTLVDAFWSGSWKGADRTWRGQIRVNNLLDRRVVEPGFNGVDLPGYGRQIMLTFGCQF